MEGALIPLTRVNDMRTGLDLSTIIKSSINTRFRLAVRKSRCTGRYIVVALHSFFALLTRRSSGSVRTYKNLACTKSSRISKDLACAGTS